MSVTKAVLASSTFALIATTTPVLAQERTADARLSSEEIIVTARRREENIQDVPVAITALGTEALEKANITDVEDLNGAVPALLITPATTVGNSTLNFSIRGLNQGEYTGLADPSVSLYVNDVAVPRAYLANLGLYDIESVQVLRGPQGTLFGRNTTGGAVLVNSKRPEDRFTASLQGTIGNFDTYELEGHVNLPIGGSGGLRLAARHEETGGYVTNTLTGNKVDHENRDSFRVSFLADPGESFQSLFVFEYNDLNDGGPGFYARPSSIFGAITQVNSIYETQSNTTEFTKASLLRGCLENRRRDSVLA